MSMDQTSEAEIIFRKKKLEEIVEVLLNAGYHRAMSKSLSEFDKVVGGLCWCITSIGIDVDVDILFQENLIIGQRIALSEAIITALRIMGCPSPLQAHQIQGTTLDNRIQPFALEREHLSVCNYLPFMIQNVFCIK